MTHPQADALRAAFGKTVIFGFHPHLGEAVAWSVVIPELGSGTHFGASQEEATYKLIEWLRARQA